MSSNVDRDALIAQHYHSMPTRMLADQLSMPRNTLISAARRLGLNRPRGTYKATNVPAYPRAPRPKREPRPTTTIADVMMGRRQHLSPWKTCQWIDAPSGLGDPPRCGCPTVAGSSWCNEHYARVFSPRRPNRPEPIEQPRLVHIEAEQVSA